jgi:hypothetical protein
VSHPWEQTEYPDDCGYGISIRAGVFQLSDGDGKKINYEFPDLATFVGDMHLLCALIADGPLKSFCYRRLSYLSSKFQLHVLLNELRELAAQKAVAHRDFYNVRKVRSQALFSRQFFGKCLSFLGGHAHPRCLLHEPEALASLYQEGSEDGRRERGVPHQGRKGDDADRGVQVDEPNGLRPHRRHARRARGKRCMSKHFFRAA